MAQKRKLNRGLEALLGSGLLANPAEPSSSESSAELLEPSTAPITELPVERLQRGAYQPRREFEPEALESLASSIKAQGVLQPIVARPLDGDRYEILSGERR